MPIKKFDKSGILAYFGPKVGHFGHFFEIWTSYLFCPPITLMLKGKPSWKFIGPKFTIHPIKPSKNPENGHISKLHLVRVAITKKPVGFWDP